MGLQVMWYSHEGNVVVNAHHLNHWNTLQNCAFKITAISLERQWVKQYGTSTHLVTSYDVVFLGQLWIGCNNLLLDSPKPPWRIKSPASRLFTQPYFRAHIKENIKAPRHWPLYGEFTGDRWIPSTNGQWRGKCFHLMTSSCFPRHHWVKMGIRVVVGVVDKSPLPRHNLNSQNVVIHLKISFCSLNKLVQPAKTDLTESH